MDECAKLAYEIICIRPSIIEILKEIGELLTCSVRRMAMACGDGDGDGDDY